MSAWGMNVYILSIFFTSANWSADIHKESLEKSKTLQEKTDTLDNIFGNIREIGEKVSGSGHVLDSGITDVTATMHEMVESNEIILNKVKNQVDTIEKNTETIQLTLGSFEKIVDVVEQQSVFVGQGTRTITEMVDSISQVFEKTEQTRTIAGDLSQLAEDGKVQVQDSSKAIHAIETASSSVKNIVESIQKIADQTNILAMNAAIQSAHAGEYGKGFAVVANEIRNLSVHSGEQASEINLMIDSMAEKIKTGVETFDQVKRSLDKIIRGTGDTTRLIAEISAASRSTFRYSGRSGGHSFHGERHAEPEGADAAAEG